MTLPTGKIEEFEFDTSRGVNPSAIRISPTVCAVAYYGVDFDGFLKTIELNEETGNIGNVINTLEFDTVLGGYPHIIPISGDIYAIVYTGPDSDGWLVTVEIDSAGNITDSIIGSHEFDTSHGVSPRIVHISGTTYAIVYAGPDDDGWLKTLTIANDGTIAANPELDSYEFDTHWCYTPDIIHISGDIYAIFYGGDNEPALYGRDLRVVTVDIDGAGNIAGVHSAIITMPREGQSGGIYPSRIAYVADGVYAVALKALDTDVARKVFIYTIGINSSGTIAGKIDSSALYAADQDRPDLIKYSGTTYCLSYTNTTGGMRLWTIEDDGTIGDTPLSGFVYDSVAAHDAPSVLIEAPLGALRIIVIFFGGAYYDGWIWTVGVKPTVTTQAMTDVAGISATGNGNVTSLGNPIPTQHGHCWNTTGYPDIDDDHVDNGAKEATGAFTSVITGLTPNTKYYVRAYAINAAASGFQTRYGDEVTFTTTAGVGAGIPGVIELLT